MSVMRPARILSLKRASRGRVRSEVLYTLRSVWSMLCEEFSWVTASLLKVRVSMRSRASLQGGGLEGGGGACRGGGLLPIVLRLPLGITLVTGVVVHLQQHNR